MSLRSHSDERSLERFCPTLFLVSGVLLVGHAAIWGIRLFTDASPPTGVFAAVGHLLAVVALTLLYPVLADRPSPLARGAVVTAVVPATGWFVIALTQLVEISGVLPSRYAAIPPVFYVVVLLSTTVTYVLFTVASRRASVDSPTLRLLLPTPAALLVVGVTVQGATGARALVGFGTGCGIALALLAIGFRLRTTAIDRGRPTADVTTG